MNILIMLLVLFAQQAVWANGTTLSRSTRHLLKTGLLFNLEKPITNTREGDATARSIAFMEIYRLSDRVDEAREIVEAEHGVEALDDLNYLLKLQEVADSLDVEIDFKTAMVIRIAMRAKEYVTKDDLVEFRKEITQEIEEPKRTPAQRKAWRNTPHLDAPLTTQDLERREKIRMKFLKKWRAILERKKAKKR